MALAMTCAVPAAAEIVTYGEGADIRKNSNIRLDPGEKDVLKWMSDGRPYFGAMYVNQEIDHAFAVINYHRYANAVRAAEAGCRTTSVSAPDRCVLYATVTPKGFAGNSSNPDGIGRDAEIGFRDAFLKNQKKGQFGAFAVSGMSESGWSWGAPSRQVAVAAAMANCEAGVASTLATFNAKARAFLEQSGYAECRAVVVAGP